MATVCPDCEGTGLSVFANQPCFVCEGAGNVMPAWPSLALDPATEIPCRFAEVGCQSPATAIYHVPKGCVCWPDPVQALCDQHQNTIESVGPAIRIVALRAPRQGARR